MRTLDSLGHPLAAVGLEPRHKHASQPLGHGREDEEEHHHQTDTDEAAQAELEQIVEGEGLSEDAVLFEGAAGAHENRKGPGDREKDHGGDEGHQARYHRLRYGRAVPLQRVDHHRPAARLGGSEKTRPGRQPSRQQ